MGSRSHLVGKGAMKEYLAYQNSVRRSARAGAVAAEVAWRKVLDLKPAAL